MTDFEKVARISGAVLSVSGCALLIGPLILGVGGAGHHAAALNFGLVGLVFLIVGMTAWLSGPSLLDWVGLAAALWLTPSPWILGFATEERAVFLNLVVALFALMAAHWGIAAAEMRQTERECGDRAQDDGVSAPTSWTTDCEGD